MAKHRGARIVSGILFWCGTIVVCVGLYKLAVPVLAWSKTAHWRPETALDTLRRAGLEKTSWYRWLVSPKSWFGVHELVADVIRWPVFVFYLLAGFFLLLASDAAASTWPERRSELDSWR